MLAFQFGCSTAASQQQMALNFELVASDQLFSVVLASCKGFQISAPGEMTPKNRTSEGKNRRLGGMGGQKSSKTIGHHLWMDDP